MRAVKPDLQTLLDDALARIGSDLRGVRDGAYLWVCGPRRYCLVDATSRLRCVFGEVRTALAVAETADVADLALPIQRWLVEPILAAELVARHPFAHTTEVADFYEQGRLAEWRWRKLRRMVDKVAATGSGLDPYLQLFPVIAQRPSINGFFAFFSVNRLRFSRCPYYPFSTYGLPIVVPRSDQEPDAAPFRVQVGDRTFDGAPKAVCDFLNEALTAEGNTTFDGNVEDGTLAAVDRELSSMGSRLRCERAFWGGHFFTANSGDRGCRMHTRHDARYNLLCFAGRADADIPARPTMSFDLVSPRELARGVKLWLDDRVTASHLEMSLSATAVEPDLAARDLPHPLHDPQE